MAPFLGQNCWNCQMFMYTFTNPGPRGQPSPLYSTLSGARTPFSEILRADRSLTSHVLDLRKRRRNICHPFCDSPAESRPAHTMKLGTISAEEHVNNQTY